MYAKQYEITLPADYDMRIIRKRVANTAHLLDDRAGLGLKAYLIRERGVAIGGADSSPVNQYAPLYLWNDTGAMARFLVGGAGFERIIASFGRAPVRHWTGLAAVAGPGRADTATTASRRLTTIPPEPGPGSTAPDAGANGGEELSARIEREIDELVALGGQAGVHTAALALDPRDWQLMRFVLWAGPVPAGEDATERYEVLHLSAPEPAGLPRGRAW
jgi:uncharacterized protein DUF4865